MSLDWFFESVSPMGGASAGAYRNPLAGAGVPEADLFAREAIQNSVDAALPNSQQVRVVFRTAVLREDKLQRFRAALDLGLGSTALSRPDLLKPDSLADLLAEQLPVLYVEDFNTVGIGGTTDSRLSPTEEDNYIRLCLQLGETRDVQTSKGGTFGYGKAVYWAVSSLWTVVMYSRFEPSERTAGEHARLIAVSWFNAHTSAGAPSEAERRYTGRAWLGRVVRDQGESQCIPVTDKAAHALARELGFTPRESMQDTGLSLMVLGHRVDLAELRKGVEKHWWPRILDGRLAVEIGGEHPPSPRGRRDLHRYVRAWDLIKGKADGTDEDRVATLSYKKKTLGRFGITTGATEDEPSDAVAEESDSRRVQVALVRRPGMVVEYLEGPYIAPGQPVCQGVFLADEAMDAVLAASEPPAHTTWDSRTIRRDRGLTEVDQKRIAKIYEKIRIAAREFLRAQQEPPPKPPARCYELEKLLGKYLATKPEGPRPPPPPSSDPFQIRFVDSVERVQVEEGTVLDCRVAVSVKDEVFGAGDQVIVCRARAWVDPILDHGGKAPRSDRLPMEYMSVHDPVDHEEILGMSDQQGSYIDFIVTPGSDAHVIDLRSAPLPHHEYRASFGFSVEILE